MGDMTPEQIELKIAFLEHAHQQLSDVVYRQQRELENLRTQMTAYQRQIDTWKSEQMPVAPVDERPPHY
ncbi:MAG: SlyX family protein [Gammaproteobacteria bacterium]|nr:SlyX family protein [Gammaproteobacteria bacterium]